MLAMRSRSTQAGWLSIFTLCLDLCVYALLGKSKRGAKGPGQDRRKCGCASELLETQRHGLVLVCYARLAPAPYPIVLADAAPSALLACAPSPSVLADARPSALLSLIHI